ncbi:Pentatricopeptide repeat-containing protein [Platanthera zijinensis]|uniref:Pentatricopeptide repeat-containing protein n=1 Tax=Platanthera zijinensis TaxID=2320716 RepID=A0AAP0BX95_9ASPA
MPVVAGERKCANSLPVELQFSGIELHQQGAVAAEERLIALLQRCRLIPQLHQIQSQAIVHGLLQSPYVAPKAAAAYFESSNPESARHLFDQIPEPNTVFYNVMFKGYTEAALHKETLQIFSQMKRRDARPNLFTFPFVIQSCMLIPAPAVGDQVHCFAAKTGLRSNVFVGTALINSFACRADAESAYKVFDEMPERNMVVWTAIIRAYIAINDVGTASHLFNQLEQHDAILCDTMISAFVEHGDMAAAVELFAGMPIRDAKSWNTILRGYANSPDIRACERFFKNMPVRNVFSWNELIGGYARHGSFSDAVNSFHRMLISSDVKPNDATLVAVLSSCSKLGALNWGRWIHLYADNNGFKSNIFVGNALVDMYAKCGCIRSAARVFASMGKKDVITWNTLISGLAMHGMGLEALELFDQMVAGGGETPDGITFVGALSACAHAGLVERGFACFRSMARSYSIEPWIAHYGCVVNLLGRAGLLSEAVRFVKEMPVKADDVVWSALLGACREWGNVHLAEVAMSRLTRLVPEDVANYVVLSNIYGDAGMWEDVCRLQKVMRRMSAGKTPGCSMVEVNFEVVEFCSSDARHARSKDVYELLQSLAEVSRFVGDELNHDDNDDFQKVDVEWKHELDFQLDIEHGDVDLVLENNHEKYNIRELQLKNSQDLEQRNDLKNYIVLEKETVRKKIGDLDKYRASLEL